MSHFQPVEPAIPWLLIGTQVGMASAAGLLVYWIYALITYWMNKPSSRRYEADSSDEEDEPEEEVVQPVRRSRRKKRVVYEDY